MFEPIFQQAQPQDLERVWPFIRAYYELDGIPFSAAEIRGALAALLGDPSLDRLWIVEVEEEPVGYAVVTFGYDLEFGGSVATVTELYISPAYRRRGIGRRLIHFLETVCRNLGVAALELQVEQKNIEAKAFYRALGFEAHERIPLSKRLHPFRKPSA